jgi:integrase
VGGIAPIKAYAIHGTSLLGASLRSKKQNKNATSSRDVPILIPELKEVLERDRKPSGRVLECSRAHFLRQVHRTCQANNITDVTIHGLRHSFASLAHHLNVPEKIVQEIGGWSDSGTMRKIYTHISKKDITKYQDAFADFYKKPDAKGS